MTAEARLVAVALLVVSTATGSIRASVPDVRPLTEFQRVYLTGPATLNIVQGARSSMSVTARGAEVVPLVAEVADGVLYLDVPTDHGGRDDLVIDLTLIDLKELVSHGDSRVVGRDLALDILTLDGDGEFRFHDLTARELHVVSEGAASFEIDGRVDHQVIDASGTFDYHGAALKSSTGEVRLAGAGSVQLWVDDVLDVQIAGTARVSYRGAPYVHQTIMGAGRIDQVVRMCEHRVRQFRLHWIQGAEWAFLNSSSW